MSEYPRLCVVTQRAGPLTKTYSTDRFRYVRRAARHQCRGSPDSGPANWNKPAQKLELYLALFGFSGAHYVLTFRDEDLPQDFDGVKRCLRNFVRRVHRRYPEVRRYVYAVEAGHERGRWHIHFVADEQELPLEAVTELWRCGFVNPGYHEYPVLCHDEGYFRLAKYLCKPDRMRPLGKHPWGVAAGMKRLIPPPTTKVQTRLPGIPKDAFWRSVDAAPVREVNGRQTSPLMEYRDWIAAPKLGTYQFLEADEKA